MSSGARFQRGRGMLLFSQSRELAIAISWKDNRQMCAVKFLRLEDFLDAKRHGMPICLEPQGILFVEVCMTLSVDIITLSLNDSFE